MRKQICWVVGALVVLFAGFVGIQDMLEDHNARVDMRDDITVAMQFTIDQSPKSNPFRTKSNPRTSVEKKGVKSEDVIEMNVLVKGCSVELERIKGEQTANLVNGRTVQAYTIDEVLYNYHEIDLEDFGLEDDEPMVFTVAEVEAFLLAIWNADNANLPCFVQ